MDCFRFAMFLLLVSCVLPAAESRSFPWDDYYFDMRQVEGSLRSVAIFHPGVSDSCINQLFWAIFNWKVPPRCDSIIHYHHEQTDGESKWCVDKHGTPLEYTLDLIQTFPYNCKKSRRCISGTVYEKTGRCEASCEEATNPGYRTKYECANMCICPRGKYLNRKGSCVWRSECELPTKRKPSCPTAMVYTECATRCPPTCATPIPVCYVDNCQKDVHCVCPDNMVQMSTINRTCVEIKDCPKCEHGSVAGYCAPACPDTCPDGVVCEREGCEEGVFCICPPRTVRRDRLLPVRCVPKSECPPMCEPPRVPKGCGTACPPTCDDPEPVCTEQCVPENICACPAGYVQLSKTDKTCVMRSECPGCRAPAMTVKCTPACPESCGPKSVICVRQCKSKYACECPPGSILSSLNGRECVKKGKCPPVCRAPKRFSECPSLCQPTCQNLKPASCKRGCGNPRCICPLSMVQPDGDNLTCISPSECPTICEPPRVAKGCGTACPATCDDPEPVCTEQCVPENICACPDGYVQLSKTDKTCVMRSECPGCRAPATTVKCTRACPESCGPKSVICVRQCESKYACECPSGSILSSLNGRECVKKGKCPPVCKAPKRYSVCPSLCQPTCQNPKPASCKRGCGKPRCICPLTMVQPDDDTPTCISPSECPKECDAPKIYKKCPRKCQPSCTDQNPDCQPGCGEDQCVCPTGMVLLTKEEPKCVKPSLCPPVDYCPFPAIRDSCRSKCTVRCDNLATINDQDCSLECGGDFCVCPSGYVRKSKTELVCVRITSCPPPVVETTTPSDPRCDYPKVYAKCATKCPPTCDNKKPLTCSRMCDPLVDCVCRKGFVQLSKLNTTCIKPEDCPVCKSPKIYVECASKCRPTCQTPNPAFCDDSCDLKLHCVCPPDMVHPKNGDDSCIPLSECPESCQFPTVATDCVSKCPASCDDPVPKCEEKCIKGNKCVCPTGLLQRSATNTTCVLPSRCPGLPNDCALRKVPTRCANGCPATCKNQYPRFCTKPCRPDVTCECPRGMVQRSLEDDTCLWPYQCET